MADKKQIEGMQVYGILPNLALQEPFECEWIALLPGSDERMLAIASKDRTVRQMLNGFYEQDGKRCEVASLVVKKDAPPSVDLTALMSFRNLFAMSCILKGWQSSAGQLNVFHPLYADYFDFYPFRPVGDGIHIHHLGAALSSWNSTKRFRAQRNADLPSFSHGLRAEPDKDLRGYLIPAWKQQFVDGGDKWDSLFRSLAVAYHAAGLPKKNLMWHYDFGVSIALWVSAFETLCHPGKSKQVKPIDVLKLLAPTKLSEDEGLSSEFTIKVKDKPITVNAVQYLYWKLNGARNCFLHGDAFPQEKLFLGTKNNPVMLTQVAPILFKAALLNKFNHFSGEDEMESDASVVFTKLLEKRAFSKAVSFLINGKRD